MDGKRIQGFTPVFFVVLLHISRHIFASLTSSIRFHSCCCQAFRSPTRSCVSRFLLLANSSCAAPLVSQYLPDPKLCTSSCRIHFSIAQSSHNCCGSPAQVQAVHPQKTTKITLTTLKPILEQLILFLILLMTTIVQMLQFCPKHHDSS